MKILKRILLIVLAVVLVSALIGVPAVIAIRGNIKSIETSDEFKSGIKNAQSDLAEGADVRIMSSNLLVHYASWGGTPAKPRAKMFTQVLDTYKPDVVGLQEVSDEWYCCLIRNSGSYKMLYPVSTGALVVMTGMIYNSDTLKLEAKGKFTYEQGDNGRLRRVVWGVFQRKEDGKRFAVTSTHLDLIREGTEKEELATMTSQANELFNSVNDIAEKYDCPVFSTGDFNAMENGSINGEYDAPEIYALLSDNLTDTKGIAQQKTAGDFHGLDTPTYDHIFLKGEAEIKQFQVLSYKFLTDMSDHFPIFIDAKLS